MDGYDKIHEPHTPCGVWRRAFDVQSRNIDFPISSKFPRSAGAGHDQENI
jgi:hypothetical protein